MRRGSAVRVAMRVIGSGFAAGLLLVVLTVVVYFPTTHSSYVWDDDYYVEKNEALRSTDGLWRIWSDTAATPQYYPLVFTTYWLEYRLWELDPVGYHVVNILLHALAAVLLWRVLAFLRVPAAWVVAAVFALHPAHVESVAWITERKNVLSGVFYFGSALAYLHYALDPRSSGSRRKGLFVASLVLFLCALLSKTVTCSLPAALLLVLWWKHGRITGTDVRCLIPFFVAGMALAGLTLWLEMDLVGSGGDAWQMPIIGRCLIAGRAFWFYAHKLFWPDELMFVYPRWRIDVQDWRQYLFPVSAAGCVLALWLARSRIGRGPLVAMLFFVGTLVPALGFFDVYFFRYSYVADHFHYLGSVGLIVLAVTVGQQVASRFGIWGKRIGTIVVVLLLGSLATLSWRHQGDFSDRETLWRRTLEKNDDAWMAHNNLGNMLQARGDVDEAIDRYRRALQLKPDFTDAHHNLALMLREKGRLSDAIRHFRLELEFYTPDHAPRFSAEAHHELGRTFAKQGRLSDAVAQYRSALKINPDYAAALNNLGIALQGQGKYDEAIRHYVRALEIAPGDALVHNNLGAALYMQGKLDEAIVHYRRAIAIDPAYAQARRNLASAEAMRRRTLGPGGGASR